MFVLHLKSSNNLIFQSGKHIIPSLDGQRLLQPLVFLNKPVMQTCAHCGHEEEDSSTYCTNCGLALSASLPPMSLPTPHRVLGEIQHSIWHNFAEKRGRFYFAGFLIGMFGAVIAATRQSEHGFQLWTLAGGGAAGIAAVWLLSMLERAQARIKKARDEGRPTKTMKALFVFLGFVALVAVALVVAALCAYLT